MLESARRRSKCLVKGGDKSTLGGGACCSVIVWFVIEKYAPEYFAVVHEGTHYEVFTPRNIAEFSSFSIYGNALMGTRRYTHDLTPLQETYKTQPK